MQKKFRTLSKVGQVHRISGISLSLFLLILSISGLLLAWKKHSSERLMPSTARGSSTELAEWLPLDSLRLVADLAIYSSLRPESGLALKRIDARPSKGSLKFMYAPGNWEVQLDGANGQVLNIGRRHADLIESIHDGSIVDDSLGSGSFFKLFYSSITGLSLLMFLVTGIWLWLGKRSIMS